MLKSNTAYLNPDKTGASVTFYTDLSHPSQSLPLTSKTHMLSSSSQINQNSDCDKSVCNKSVHKKCLTIKKENLNSCPTNIGKKRSISNADSRYPKFFKMLEEDENHCFLNRVNDGITKVRNHHLLSNEELVFMFLDEAKVSDAFEKLLDKNEEQTIEKIKNAIILMELKNI